MEYLVEFSSESLICKLFSLFPFLTFSPSKISKQRAYLRRIKFFLITFLYLLILAGCFVIIFVIAAQQDGSENISWAIYFAISLAQDLTLSPLISIINKVFLLTLPKKYDCLQGKTSQQFFTVLIPEAFKSIYVNFFENFSSYHQLGSYFYSSHSKALKRNHHKLANKPSFNKQKTPQIRLF